MEYKLLGINIKHIQKIAMEILIEFDRICKKHDINYQLFAGTLLGAVRHNGFIPWDDDVDVCLMRNDYEKFIKVCEKELHPNYFLQTFDTDSNFRSQFAKIRKNNTLFMEKVFSEDDIHHGVFIDIFPLDNVKPNSISGEIQRILSHVTRGINLARSKNTCLRPKNKSITIGLLLFHYILKTIPKNWTQKLHKYSLNMFSNQKTDYVNHLTNGVTKKRYNKFIREAITSDNTINGCFEGGKFPIPKNYDEILTKIYGDYMQLPPLEQRETHHGICKIVINNRESDFYHTIKKE